jgi:hypothetical protein
MVPFGDKMFKFKWRSFRIPLRLALVLSLSFAAVAPIARTDPIQGSVSLIYEVYSVFSGRLTHIITVKNPASDTVIDGKLYVPLINNKTGSVYVVIINMTSTAGNLRLLQDDFGNFYACWEGIIISPNETFTSRIEYYVVSFETRFLTDSSEAMSYNENAALCETFTQSEELIESNASEIAARARSLCHDAVNIHERVVRIYDFVISYLRYDPQEDERGALWALMNRRGDCTEYSSLFVALCRAAGIPARIQTGFGFHDLKERITDGHMWTEYYLPGYGWIPADPTWQILDAMDQKHFASLRSIPQMIPYANYRFNFTADPNSGNITDNQEVILEPSPTDLFGNGIVEDTLKTIKTIGQARLAINVETFLGMSIIFHSEAEQVDQLYTTSEMNLQAALQQWTENMTAAKSYVSEALAEANEASQKAWMLVEYAFAIFIGTLVSCLSTAYILFRHHTTKTNR